jgi:hypothetical protein
MTDTKIKKKTHIIVKSIHSSLRSESKSSKTNLYNITIVYYVYMILVLKKNNINRKNSHRPFNKIVGT